MLDFLCRKARCLVLVVFALVALSAALPATARAEQGRAEVVSGRLLVLGSYGLLATFFQDDNASAYNPRFGHGFSLRLGGERCGVVCLGASAVGTIPLIPSGTGSAGGQLHVAFDRPGPDWGGPMSIRLGAGYVWHYIEGADFDQDGDVTFTDPSTAHALELTVEITLQLRRRPAVFNPIIGLRLAYDAVVSAEPVNHILAAQLVFGFAIENRLMFGDEIMGDEEPPEDLPVEGLDPEEERRLQEAEDALREP